MRIKLSKILNGAKYLPLGVLFPFLFTGELLAAEKGDSLPVYNVSAKVNQQITITGKVISSEDNAAIPGVSVSVKGMANINAVTDFDGKYVIKVPSADAILVFSYVGYKTVEKKIIKNSEVNVVLSPEKTTLEEVVVVAYGKQKKESVVAAIVQTSGAVLERTGGVSSIGAALTGNVPGVVTSASTGLPGDEDPQILIRGSSTWNNSSPLILVDGVERPMNSVAISSVESVSILKDASATAVYGSRGANGVILITTKRGSAGKAIIRARVNSTMKSVSKLPGKLDSYDTYMVRNQAIENELGISPSSWGAYLPQAIIDKYRYPANLEEAERYPNVDWAKALFKDYAMSYNASVDVRGGTDFVKYFANVDILHEGDLFRQYDNNRGYEPGFGFNRLNVRSNLDFQLTPSTVFKVNISGSHGVKKTPWGFSGGEYGAWIAAYVNSPSAYIPQYSDGSWGYYLPDPGKAINSVSSLAVSGIQYVTTTRLTTDFAIEQNLDKYVKGLSFTGTVALDNTFVEGNRGVNDLYNAFQEKWIDPVTGLASYKQSYDTSNKFDFQEGVLWNTSSGNVLNNLSQRKLFYQMQLNYKLNLAEKHNITAMGLFNRNKNALGSEIPTYREDWVFRTTYGYDGKYLFEYNGAYNGSEKFGPGNRFAFFSSGGLGWIVSKEKFMEGTQSFMNLLKIRGSYGEIGDDSVSQRFLYLTRWAYGGNALMGSTGETPQSSPYTWYKESQVGNPDVQWEKVTKTNLGVDFGFFKNLISGNIDFFKDARTDILINGNARSIPSYYGTTAPVANLGKVNNSGYEFELKFNYTFGNGLNLWSNLNMTHSKSKILYADNPALLPDYQKTAGKQLGQAYSYVSNGYYNTWDEVYGSTMNNTSDDQKLPGNYYIVDYNADGVIDSKDNIPYGYSGNPQNTYNASLGINWKGFSGFVQFYGVNNVTRQVVFSSLTGQNNLVYDEGTYWSSTNTNADVPLPRWLSTPSYNEGTRYMFDGSYVRLKYAEIAYTFDKTYPWVKSLGITDVKFYLNGNNLFLWTKMPDDRESNYAGTGWASQGAYPTVKRYNLGVNVTF
jgi:TonB-linked SusC/RagA family outer membrane protein